MHSAQQRWDSGEAGVSMAEIALALGIIGILAVTATPLLLTSYQGARLTAAARQVATSLNNGRQLAITQNAPICVHISSTAMHYHQGTCAAAVETPGPNGGYWVGSGSNASGNIPVPAGITLTSTGNTQFSYLGAAAPGATYTVKNTQTAATIAVAVTPSGRITVGP